MSRTPPVSYKSHEMNLFSADDLKKLQLKESSSVIYVKGCKRAEYVGLSSFFNFEYKDTATDLPLPIMINSQHVMIDDKACHLVDVLKETMDDLDKEVKDRKDDVSSIRSEMSNNLKDLTFIIDAEQKQRVSADLLTNQLLTAEEMRAKDAELKLESRIDFITHNTDPVALDSLSEIVNRFSMDGQSYSDRLTYLEGVIQSLVGLINPASGSGRTDRVDVA